MNMKCNKFESLIIGSLHVIEEIYLNRERKASLMPLRFHRTFHSYNNITRTVTIMIMIVTSYNNIMTHATVTAAIIVVSKIAALLEEVAGVS